MIEVDISGAFPEGLAATPELIASLMPAVLEETRKRLVQLAEQRMDTGAHAYVGGIQPVISHIRGLKLPQDGIVGSIVLTGWLPNAMEHGWAGGDMKPFLLAGRKVKTTKDGIRFNTVPFRHGAPGSGTTNFAPMGSQHEAHFAKGSGGGFSGRGHASPAQARKLGRKVHRQAKKLDETRSAPGQRTSWGHRLRSGLAPKLAAHHVTDIYAGMVRFSKQYKTKDQGGFMTFRRVSENSDPRAWIHPGIHGEHLFDEVAKEVPKIAAFMIKNALRGIGDR